MNRRRSGLFNDPEINDDLDGSQDQKFASGGGSVPERYDRGRHGSPPVDLSHS
jgi:hypothetical protein